MGKIHHNSQQSSRDAHGASSNPIYKSNDIRFVKPSQSIQNHSPRRGKLLGEMRPFWIKVKESEHRLEWLKTMVRHELVVRDVDAYAKAISEQLRSEEMKFREQERGVLLGIMKVKLRDEHHNLRKLQNKKYSSNYVRY